MIEVNNTTTCTCLGGKSASIFTKQLKLEKGRNNSINTFIYDRALVE